MFWPLEKAVHDRAVEQILMQLQVDVSRMRLEVEFNGWGYMPTSNNFPLPPDPEDDCTTACIDGTPTIPLGDTFAFRRLSIDDPGATGIVYLDWDGSAWVSPTVTLDTPLVCSAVSVDVRWKLTATGVGVGEMTLILQYDIGAGWVDGPTWENTKLWDTSCGMTFKGGTDFDPALTCNQSAPEEVCVMPVNLCEGEDPDEFFDSARVFTFTVAGVTGSGQPVVTSCTPFNRSWTVPRTSANIWSESIVSGARTYYAEIPGFGGVGSVIELRFRVLAPGNPIHARYTLSKCDFLIPGVNTLALASSPLCLDWPATIDVTCT